MDLNIYKIDAVKKRMFSEHSVSQVTQFIEMNFIVCCNIRDKVT